MITESNKLWSQVNICYKLAIQKYLPVRGNPNSELVFSACEKGDFLF